MHEKLITYIENKIAETLTEAEKESIVRCFKPKKIKRRQYLLQEGDICRFVAFIVKGSLKQFTTDESGKEDIIGLFIENWWAGDRESYSQEKPSIYNIQACEDCELLVMTGGEFESELKNQKFANKLMGTLTEKQSFHLLKRVHSAKALTAEQRIQELELNYPEFFHRFPAHILASYLGMTKETMSRIRSAAVKK